MADFSKPAMGENYTKNYDDIKSNTNAVAAMFKGVVNPQNLPQYSVKLDNGVIQRWNGSSWLGEQIQIQSGGTGASTAAGARTNLSVYSKAEIDTLEGQVQSQIDDNDTDISDLQTAKADKSITLTATSPLTGGGDLSASRSFGIQDASTAQKGAVQLNNTLTSTSTTQALTAAQGKVLADQINIGSVTIDMTGKGDFTSGTLYCARVGNMVTLTWTGLTNASMYNPDASFLLPVGYRPITSTSGTHYNTTFSEMLYVSSSGSFLIERFQNGEVFAAPTTQPGSISYRVA